MQFSLISAFVLLSLTGCSGEALPPLPDMTDRDITILNAGCMSGDQDGDESDVDCGGSCGPCAAGRMCKGPRDCASGVCVNKACAAAACDDKVKNGDESDIDCGRSCPIRCSEGIPCNDGPDCQSMACVNGLCGKSPCVNGKQDGMETDVDCGGPTCDKCADGRMCGGATDCVSGDCVSQKCRSNCPKGTGNCDGDPANGCETPTDVDTKNCGQCSNVCANNTPVCIAGKCSKLLCPNAMIDFAPHMDFPPLGYAIAAGDLNGDGSPDLAVATGGNNTVSVLINKGGGTFAAPSDLPTATSPVGVTIADLNGDGRPDLAVACDTGNTLSVLLNIGGGMFAARKDYNVAFAAYVAAADFNGDGRLDLAVGEDGLRDKIAVLLNVGGGQFGAPAEYQAGKQAFALAVGDLNADARPDILVANNSANTVSVLINNGQGNFAPHVDYPATGPGRLAIADFNGDGRADFAVTDSGHSQLNIAYGKGGGLFGDPVQVGMPSAVVGVVAVDLDGDGRPDLATANPSGGPSSTVGVLRNLGGGSFAKEVDFVSPTNSYEITSADFDRDGKIDIAVVGQSKSASVLLNRCM